MSESGSRSKRWIIVGLVVVVLGVILFGLAILSLVTVGSRAPAAPPPVATVVREVVVEKEVVVPVEAPAAEELAYQAAPSNLAPVAERMIIRTAELAIVVEDTETALLQVRGVATGLDGYVASADVWRVNEQLRGRVTIRVPAESFDTAMDQIKGLAVEVERENISAQDVTEEYTDLSARLRNLEATEEELLALLTEVREKTRQAEDVLAVHRELTNIRGQIEQIKGRMQYLERMTALATISVELIPEEEEKPIVEEGWQPLRTLRDASRALVDAGQFFVDAAIWLIVFVLPVLLVLLLPVAIVIFVWRRRRVAKQA
ncbi:MAG: DUF4349 domain-containing protein [Gemmatimonadales bacterium]|nr:DUF4349 domain-containing protein [Gemmatimonadales bacterium]